jgi:eukaryotic-like serine/threonine-protein kinase
MTPERWEQIKRLFHAALEHEPAQRAAFLAKAYAGDEILRQEVETLIASHEQAENFIETPASDVAAALLVDDQSGLTVGQTVGPYRIAGVLATGGMGQVYLADDIRLGRKIALKLLPPHWTGSEDRVRRFEQEARAASALNHPNIVTIHDIGQAGSIHYIATEFIDGHTLREHMTNAARPIREVLDVAVQVASALKAAHEAGVVHRDIKPENIMLRRDGFVKVLDFGLAKLALHQAPALVTETPARTIVKTNPGVVMGTVGYMSPEQARGQEADARTDIWSLGVVLYELVAGQQPFAGPTPTDVIISIVEREPAPLAGYSPEVPIQFERIVKKALAKDRETRYQTSQQLLIDLKSLIRELELGNEKERSKQSIPGNGLAVTISNNPVVTSRFFPFGLKRSQTLIITALVGMLIIAGVVYFLYFPSSTPAPRSEIKSLAVLPLKSLNRGSADDYLGLGIADTIIAKVSQIGELTVRPTSAVRKYADQEIDSLEAARELRADSVLDGTFLHAGDRLRISVNLLRVRDGASLWAESFDMHFTDIFAIQDQVSREVAARLRFKLSPAEQTRLSKRQTTNPEAYSYYMKAMYHFGKRGFTGDPQEDTDTAIDLFKKAIDLDPNYALAHGQLGYAYAWIADFKEGGPGLIASSKEELRLAERLDPQLAEVHIARAFIAWSHYEDWQIESAIREARLAKQLDPNLAHILLATLYFHAGLEEQAAKEFESALEQDPTSDVVKRTYHSLYATLARPDELLALNQRLFNRGPDLQYYLEKKMLKEAAPLVEQEYVKNPDEPEPRRDKALLLALQGKHKEAQAAVPRIMEKVRRDKAYHHFTYNIARIYALGSKSEEALKWLRITAKEGFPCYTLFARDSFLDPIRKDQAFTQFMTEMETRWEGYRREFE